MIYAGTQLVVFFLIVYLLDNLYVEPYFIKHIKQLGYNLNDIVIMPQMKVLIKEQ